MQRIRVSDLDAFLRFMEPEIPEFEVSLDDFLAYLRREQEATDDMRAGSALHSLLENAQEGVIYDELIPVEVDGFRFRFACDLDLTLPSVREMMIEREYDTEYGPVLLRGRVDGIEDDTITDYKLTSSSFDAERYARSLQWRAYLDMTGRKRFRHVVFCSKRTDRDVWVYDAHEFVQWAYPEMHTEVGRWVRDLARFIHEHAPELVSA